VRLGRPIPDWEGYAAPTLGKGQGRATLALPGNLARNLKTFGPLGLLRHARWAFRHPRDRLISALPLLLANPGAAASPAVADALEIQQSLLRYYVQSTWRADERDVRTLLQQPPTGDPIMQTFVERCIEQGVQHGRQQCIAQGERQGNATALSPQLSAQ